MITLKKIFPVFLFLLVALGWQACTGGAEKREKEAKEGEAAAKKKLEAYMDSVAFLQNRMSDLISSGKASLEEINELRDKLKGVQGQLDGSMNALRAEQGKNAELTAYIAKKEQEIKEKNTQIADLMTKMSNLEAENKDQKKTIEEQKAENESAKKTIDEQNEVITSTKNQKEFTVALSSLQDKYNTAFEKAKAAKKGNECEAFREAYKYARQIGELCEGKESMVKEAGKTYATMLGLKEQVLKRAESDMTRAQYAKCFSGYK
jgi:chromosome segregation ATPase